MAARSLSFKRTMAAAEPMANDGRGLQRRAESEFGQAIQRFAVIGAGRKCQGRLVAARRSLEQTSVMALHFFEMADQDLGKGIAAGESKKPREPFEIVALGRQRLGLFVIDHLQPVLDLS